MRNPATARAGLTMVELLVAVILIAIIMAAVSTAMHASLRNYTVNEQTAIATQAARTTLNRIAGDARSALGIDQTTANTKLSLVPPETGVTDVSYELADGKLTWSRTDGTGTVVETLLGGTDDEVQVVSFSAVKLNGKDAKGVSCVVNVAIELKVRVGDETVLMKASASPRRNQVY